MKRPRRACMHLSVMCRNKRRRASSPPGDDLAFNHHKPSISLSSSSSLLPSAYVQTKILPPSSPSHLPPPPPPFLLHSPSLSRLLLNTDIPSPSSTSRQAHPPPSSPRNSLRPPSARLSSPCCPNPGWHAGGSEGGRRVLDVRGAARMVISCHWVSLGGCFGLQTA